ncbi:hypothetical protein [Amycolatopsis sulphurea]|uniref:hypothetical protein n=1 Tax=Amycolatopsis sulphurea TaxID=76022 RepID=UPI000BF93B3F|nr:hypothetical protein [Amycolatopsis sulphurea]
MRDGSKMIGLFDKLAEHREPCSADMRGVAAADDGQAAAVLAAQGLAYEEMLAAGGPDDSRGWVEYEALTRRHAGLMAWDLFPV